MRPSRLAAAAAVVLAAGLLPAVSGSSSAAPPPDPTFRPLDGFEPRGDRVRVAPLRYSAVGVDLGQIRAELSAVPPEGAGGAVAFAVPTPSGGTEEFTLARTETLAPELAAAHPEIATYAGRSVDDPTTTIALDVTPMGLHAAVRGPQGQDAWYVDPAYDRRGATEHVAFYGRDATSPAEAFVERQAPDLRRAAVKDGTAQAVGGGVVVEKRYRLALASDPSYAAYFGTDNVLAEKATLISRVNQIYRQDLAITMQLINETDELNFDTAALATEPGGPCGGEPCYRTSIYPDGPPEEDYGDLDFCSPELLGRNRSVLGQVVGADTYDVGHIALGNDGGGIAYLGVAGADYKGGGCTGLPEPKGDFFAIDYVAHELGHQFSGNHTFDGLQSSCRKPNRNGATSVEPGSGSSVMAYAGICRQDDLQPHTDPYFSFRSLDEINRYTARPIPSVVEVQTVSLSGFGAPGSSVTLGFGGATVQVAASDDAAAIQTKIETLTGQDVTIAGWGYDPYGDRKIYPAPLTPVGPTGFQVIFDATPAPDAPGPHEDVAPLAVVGGSAGVSGFVGETATGGPADNGGIATSTTTDRAPRVTRVSVARRIPIRTPFMLTGAATDADGDPLTYLWEQTDRGLDARGTSLVSNRKIYGPLFRVFGRAADVSDADSLESPAPGINLAERDSTRSFPDLGQVLSGNTNARTGTCPKVAPLPVDPADYVPVAAKVVECYSEYLPTKNYLGTFQGGRQQMHFRMTVRDGRGGVAHRNTTLRVVPNAGPFLVTSQARRSVVRRGSELTVRWQVNGTRSLSERVTIYLSTDGGRTWKHTLAPSTLNDGAQTVSLPRVRSTRARIVVAARGSYFYAVNDSRFTLR